MLLDAERKQICRFFEENKIWYMPLKGVYMKEYYPKIGMRQMCDNDILIDRNFADAVDAFMKERGYESHSDKLSFDYAYTKNPCYNFEMHRQLFAQHHVLWCKYYEDVKESLIKDNDNEYGFHFSVDDFYIYMICHEYNHYHKGGTGLRSLADTYVYLKKFSDRMNMDYIQGECGRLEIDEFEEKSRKLALKLFSSADYPELAEDEQEMLGYYLGSGTYGTVSNSIETRMNSAGNRSKVIFILRRIFPPMETYRHYYPFFCRHKILLPIGWAYRLARGIFAKNKMIKSEIKTIVRIKND